MKRTIIFAALAAAASYADAQSLSTEITVDRIVVPELRGASRISVIPSLLPTAGFPAEVVPAEYAGPGSLSSMLCTLQPAPWLMSTEKTPYRGYAGVGIFPGFNAAANAGYRFVDNGAATVGAWLNYDGFDYKYRGTGVKSHVGTLGAYAGFNIGDAGRLTLDATGLAAGVSDFAGGTKGNGAVEAHASWQGALPTFSYDATIGGSYFGMGKEESHDAAIGNNPLRQAMLTFGAGIGACHSGERWRWIGIDIDGALLKTKGLGATLGQYHFTPYVTFEASDFRLRLGAKLSVGSGNDQPAARVAPSVTIAYAPEHSRVGAELTATGGETLNPVLDIFENDPFVSSYGSYGRTNIPVNLTGSVHFGRFAGFGMELHAAYASARNLLLPDGNCTGMYSAWRANTWMAGADVSYAWRTCVIVGVGADAAGAGDNEGNVGWYEWSDRAKAEVSAYVHATPIKALDVNLDFKWRHDRRSATESLGAVRNLELSGHYRITPALTANLTISNLLCHRYMLISGLPSQGLHGLVGVSYKF